MPPRLKHPRRSRGGGRRFGLASLVQNCGRAPGPSRGPCFSLFALAGRGPPCAGTAAGHGPRARPLSLTLAGRPAPLAGLPPIDGWPGRLTAAACGWLGCAPALAAARSAGGLRLACFAAGLGRPLPAALRPARSRTVRLAGGRAPQFGDRGRRFRVRSLRSRWRPPSPDRRPPRPAACGVRSPRASRRWLARFARGQRPAALAGGRRSAAARVPPAPCLAPVTFGLPFPPLLCRGMRLACFAASRPPRRRQPLAPLAVKPTAAAAGRRSCG